jgi:hypothetical protein
MHQWLVLPNAVVAIGLFAVAIVFALLPPVVFNYPSRIVEFGTERYYVAARKILLRVMAALAAVVALVALIGNWFNGPTALLVWLCVLMIFASVSVSVWRARRA